APDLPAVMAALDIGLYVPLESDGMSRVLFEYLAAGRPLIASRTGVVPEVLPDGEHAVLVPAGDAGALAEAIARLVGDGSRRRRPLILDIDDWEVGFFYRSGGWGRLGRWLNVSNPNGLPWTWLAERLVPRADALTVASRFLADRFGGALVPHVRDTEAWAPERFDRAAARARLGVGDARVVMFLGTPRAHQGVEVLVEATAGLDDARLVVVGADPASAAARRWAAREHVRVVGEIPFDDVPRYLVAADVVAIPQRATTDTP